MQFSLISHSISFKIKQVCCFDSMDIELMSTLKRPNAAQFHNNYLILRGKRMQSNVTFYSFHYKIKYECSGFHWSFYSNWILEFITNFIVFIVSMRIEKITMTRGFFTFFLTKGNTCFLCWMLIMYKSYFDY